MIATNYEQELMMNAMKGTSKTRTRKSGALTVLLVAARAHSRRAYMLFAIAAVAVITASLAALPAATAASEPALVTGPAPLTSSDPAHLLPARASNTYTLTNVHSGKCLDVEYGGRQDFIPVIQYRCYGGPIQKWRLTYYSSTRSYTLTNVNSGKCLDVEYGALQDFIPVIQYRCYGGPVQQWKIAPIA